MGKVIFGGGCFWCIEAAFSRIRGVQTVTSGYAGGAMQNPTYEAICAGNSGHAEVVQVEFNPTQVTYRDLLTVFFAMHDPTTINRQGNDVGEQYRSCIFYTTTAERDEAREYIAELTREGVFDKPIVTKLQQLERFYPAESYHQRYYERNREQGYCSVIISPKLQKLRERFRELLRDEE